MLYTIIGIIVCLTPFILVSLYSNKVKGFLTIFTALAAVHLLTALTTQALHIFTYSVVFSVHVFVALYSIHLFFKSRDNRGLRDQEQSQSQVQEKKPRSVLVIFCKKLARNWFVVAMLFLCIFLLYSTRFNYSGVVDTAIGVKQVSDSSYTYPQYSDEWIGSGLVSYSIREKALPLVNPLNKNEPFINFLLASHSLFGEVILVFGLNPLTQYVYLAIVNGLLMSVCIFLVLRLLLVRPAFSAISALCVFLITNSGNLPSFWYILPYTASLTFFLFAIAGFVSKSKFVYLMNLIISLLLYPPIILFIAPFLLAVSYGKKPNVETIKFLALRVAIILIIAFGLLALAGLRSFSLGEMYDRALYFVIRQSLDTGKVSYQFWNIIPVFLLPFICVGLYESFISRKRFIVFPAVVGIIFWIVYEYTRTIFLMEPSRVIVITSALLLIIAGIGMEKTYAKLNTITGLSSEKFFVYAAKISVCIFFFFWILYLPRLGLWHKLPMLVMLENSERLLVPAPPVTRYLTQEDLNLFSGYKEKNFISSPWKGLVIGVATQNFPLESKSSTLTNKILKYQNFMKGDCTYKVSMARKFNISLAYSSPFDCPDNFVLKGNSSEGFNLYEFVDKANR